MKPYTFCKLVSRYPLSGTCRTKKSRTKHIAKIQFNIHLYNSYLKSATTARKTEMWSLGLLNLVTVCVSHPVCCLSRFNLYELQI